MDLRDKVVLVTGGARGIGRGIALSLARQGVHVAIADLYESGTGTAGYALANERQVNNVVEEIRSYGVQALGVPVDVTKAALVESMVDTVITQFGSIDILCNNAGILDKLTPIAEVDDALWERVMRVNVTGPFYACRKVIPLFAEQGGGVILNTASEALSPNSSGTCMSRTDYH